MISSQKFYFSFIFGIIFIVLGVYFLVEISEKIAVAAQSIERENDGTEIINR